MQEVGFMMMKNSHLGQHLGLAWWLDSLRAGSSGEVSLSSTSLVKGNSRQVSQKLHKAYGNSHAVATSVGCTPTTRGRQRSSFPPSTHNCPHHHKYSRANILAAKRRQDWQKGHILGRGWLAGPREGGWGHYVHWGDLNGFLSLGFISALSLSWMPSMCEHQFRAIVPPKERSQWPRCPRT